MFSSPYGLECKDINLDFRKKINRIEVINFNPVYRTWFINFYLYFLMNFLVILPVFELTCKKYIPELNWLTSIV